jgi:hypothetical protein
LEVAITMKWLFGMAAAVAALVLSAGTALAAPGQSQTITLHNAPISEVGPPLPFTCAGPLAGTTTFNGIGNSIQHQNFNNTGGWFTVTEEGGVTLVMTENSGSVTTYAGRITFWVGGAFNLQNTVQHATVDFSGTNVDDLSSLRLHAAFDTTTTPGGKTTANHFNVTCS